MPSANQTPPTLRSAVLTEIAALWKLAWPILIGQLANTGMAVAIDIGDPKDIHPRNKQDVGLRLALNALARTYGQEVECCGPRYRAFRRDGSKLVLAFDHADGLCARGGRPERFGIAGDDGVFHKAEAVICGATVELSCAAVPVPMAARYGWGDNPVCNLYNAAGLPMEPFRSAC